MIQKLSTVLILTSLASLTNAFEIYAGGGTTGGFIGAGHDINEHLGIRLEANHLDRNENLETSDIKYKAKLKMQNIGTYVDFYPVKAFGFRFTAGALIGKNKLTGHTDTSEGYLTIKNRNYPVPKSEYIHINAKFNTVRPFLGIGYTPKSKFGIYGDLGVAYGKLSNVEVTASNLVNVFYGSRLEKERQEIEDKLSKDKYKFYPVVKIGLQYRF